METSPSNQGSTRSTKAITNENMSESMNFQHKNPSSNPTTEELSASIPSALVRNKMDVPPGIEPSALQSESDSPNLGAQSPVHSQYGHLTSDHPKFGDFEPNDQIKKNDHSRGEKPRSRSQPEEDNVKEQLKADLKAVRKSLEEANAAQESQVIIIDGLKSDVNRLEEKNMGNLEIFEALGMRVDKDEIPYLKDQATSLREAHSKVKEDHRKLGEELSTVTAHVKELEAEQKVVENTREREKTSLSLAQHLKALDDLRRNHQAEKKALEDGRSEQQAQLHKGAEQIKQLEPEQKTAESGRNKTQILYNNATIKLQTLQEDNDKLEKRSLDLREEISWIENLRAFEQAELKESNSRSKDLADKNTKLEAEKTKLEAAVKLLEQSKRSDDKKIAKQANELTERKTEVKNLNKSIREVRGGKEILAALEAKRKIKLPQRIIIVLLFLLLAVDLRKWYYG